VELKYLPSGEDAILIQFEKKISEKINQQVRRLEIALKKSNIQGITDMIPTYCSLKIDYSPVKINYEKLIDKIKDVKNNISNMDIDKPHVIEIPTLYNGIDLEFVAEYNNITVDEVINIHTSREYLIYMLGFAPGFPYLGGISEKISTPRLENPRSKIQGGSVGIAGSQTGIYPVDIPGGWRIIGKTPLKLFDTGRGNPFLLESGNYLKFISIKKKEYEKIDKKIKNNNFEIKKYYRGLE